MSTSLPHCSRRMFILGTGASVAAAFLAACGLEAPEEIAATEVPVGSAVFLDKLMIAQPTEGQFVAYSRTCPHQSQTIDVVEGDTVVCRGHNTRYSLVDGSVIEGVGRDPLYHGKVEVTDGVVHAQGP